MNAASIPPAPEAASDFARELTEALAASLTPAEVARIAVDRAMTLLGAARCSLTFWNEETELLEVVAPAGYDEAGPTTRAYDPDDVHPLAEAFRTARPILVASPADYAARYPAAAKRSTHDGPIVVLPLTVPAAGVVGTLNVGFSPGRDVGADLPILEAFARVVAQATDRARLFASERRARQQADALVRVSSALSAAPTLRAVARVVVREGCQALGAPAGYLLGVNATGDGLDLLESVGFPGDVTRRWATMPLSAPLPLAEVVMSGRPIWLETAADAARYPLGADARATSGYLAALVAPLVIEGKAIGAVSFNFGGERRFTRSERNLTLALAGLAAHAFERAVLFDAADRARRTTEAVIAQMPVGVFIAEAPSGTIAYANDAVVRMLGGATPRPGSDYAGWLGATIDEGALGPDVDPMRRALGGEPVLDEQFAVARMDGSIGHVLVSASPIHDDAGDVMAGVAAVIDISDRVQSEVLREAFMGMLSHELRTPVTSILAAAKLLARARSSLDAATRRELVADIEIEADRLHRLVENVLVIARVERGLDLAASEPVLLQHLVPHLLQEERRRWPEAKIAVSIGRHLPTVSGDPGYIGQIVSNLVSNAIKYGGRPAEVDVSVSRAEHEVHVVVRDRGLGIEADEPDRLFEPFYRSPRSAGKAPGAGMGLFVVRQLVEAMHGRVWARPREGGGSEFGFALAVLDE